MGRGVGRSQRCDATFVGTDESKPAGHNSPNAAGKRVYFRRIIRLHDPLLAHVLVDLRSCLERTRAHIREWRLKDLEKEMLSAISYTSDLERSLARLGFSDTTTELMDKLNTAQSASSWASMAEKIDSALDLLDRLEQSLATKITEAT
jgi:hypothetical protein